MYAVSGIEKSEYNKTVLAEAQAAIDASPFKGMVRLQVQDAFVKVDDATVAKQFGTMNPYELYMVDIVSRHLFRLWRRRRAYRSCWNMLKAKLSDMRVYL